MYFYSNLISDVMAKKGSAAVVKLADTPDLGSGGEIRGGSSPSSRTKIMKKTVLFLKYFFITFFLCNLNYVISSEYHDYSLGYIYDACEVAKESINLYKSDNENFNEGREKFRTCMNFVVSLSTTLNSRCISSVAGELKPKNALTYADLSEVRSTTQLIDELINYTDKNPQFINQVAWVHVSKAFSQKWPCIK